jgi:hypothetical protein
MPRATIRSDIIPIRASLGGISGAKIQGMKKLLIGSLFALALTVGFGVSHAQAAALTGWAWGENFGWISFNSGDSGAGGGPYGVLVDTSGNWSGYAWSQYLGWVSFNAADTAVCGSAANLNTSTGVVTGWGRALVYGGTDGCIELSGTNHTSPSPGGSGGVTYDSNSNVLKGWAWGGDAAAHTGPGWIQFNPPDHPVTYNTNLSGTCTATSPYQNVSPNTNVSFQATASWGTAPFTYAWNPPPESYGSSNTFSATYSASGAGPTVKIKDSTGLTTNTVSCPSVTVLAPLGSSNLQIGRTVASANSSNLTVKQTNPFALVWNYTMSDDYSCTATVNPDPSNSSWNTNWKSLTLNPNDNGDGTKTWSGNTGTALKAGTIAVPVTPGIYQFGITCTSSLTPTPNPTQSVNATLKVNSSSEKEI